MVNYQKIRIVGVPQILSTEESDASFLAGTPDNSPKITQGSPIFQRFPRSRSTISER